MFIINIKDIHSDFIKRYGGNENDLKTFMVCSDLTVLGQGFQMSTKKYFSLPVSIRTYITLRLTNDNNYCLRFSNSDNEYICHKDELLSYRQNNIEKDIFHAISKFSKNLNGAEILFSSDVDTSCFFNPLEAVFVALSIIVKGNSPTSEEFIQLFPECDKGKNISSLFGGRKNYLLSSDNKNEYIPFNISTCKIVLVYTKLKKESPEKKLKTHLNAITQTTNTQNLEFNDIYEKYAASDTARIEKICNILKENKKITDEIIKEFNTSINEYCKICPKNSNTFKKMLSISQKSGLSILSLPQLKYNSIAVIVEENNVDSFIDFFSKNAREILGTSVSFYICDTQNSGIEIFNNT